MIIYRMLLRHLAEFSEDRSGLSAVEFAMLLPLMLTLYLGSVEVSNAVAADRKVSITARTVADLATQYASIDHPTMSNILKASSVVIAPYSPSNLTVTVSQVKIDQKGKPTIDWSCSTNGAAHSVGQTVSVPASLIVPNTTTYLIWGEAQYIYKPVVGYVITGTLTLKDQIYMAPRLTSSVSPAAC
jgi:Flp pilus assembly protein TadG